MGLMTCFSKDFAVDMLSMRFLCLNATYFKFTIDNHSELARWTFWRSTTQIFFKIILFPFCTLDSKFFSYPNLYLPKKTMKTHTLLWNQWELSTYYWNEFNDWNSNYWWNRNLANSKLVCFYNKYLFDPL